MKNILLSFFIMLSFVVLGQNNNQFSNPIINADMADPTVIKIGDNFFATGTSSEWAPHYPMFTSKDLVNWEQIGYVFDKRPEWTSSSFWAPELFYHNNKVFCYYTARHKSDNISYIGVASADTPYDEFIDHGIIIEHGSEAIDAYIYNDNGQLYISWKAYGLDPRPIELVGSKLSNDGLTLVGEPFTMLIDDEGIGMEGQSHLKIDDYYYLIYSAGGCCGPRSNYDVRVARSKSFEGPYEKYEGNPILMGGNDEVLSCGHGTPVRLDDGRFYYLFHAYQAGSDFFLGRQPAVQEFKVTDAKWLEFTTGNPATLKQDLPFTETVQKTWDGFYDNFKGSKLKQEWTWNFTFADVDAKFKKNNLVLSGHAPSDKMTRSYSVLCLRPSAISYSYETKVLKSDESFKGLTMYGDDKNLIAFGLEGTQLIVKSYKDSNEQILFSIKRKKNIYLKAEVTNGSEINFYYSSNGNKWNRVFDKPLDVAYLVPWDRVARPGLFQTGENSSQGRFSYFDMQKKY